MKLTKEQGRDLVYGDLQGWITVQTEITDTSRWSVHHSGVFKHLESGKFYKTSWDVGATEQQDEPPFEYDEPKLQEVIAQEVTVTKFVPVAA